MKTKKISGKEYQIYPNGILIPLELVEENRVKVRCPNDMYPFFSHIANDEQETVLLITLDGNNKVINTHTVTIGIANASQIHPREIFKHCIRDNAVTFAVAHNHPSGNLEPSEADLVATKRLTEASKIIGIPFLEHLIIGRNSNFLSIRKRFPQYFI